MFGNVFNKGHCYGVETIPNFSGLYLEILIKQRGTLSLLLLFCYSNSSFPKNNIYMTQKFKRYLALLPLVSSPANDSPLGSFTLIV